MEKRNVGIDILRVCAMFGVVLSHTGAVAMTRQVGTANWQVVNLLVTATEISVPLFFMISGALVLNSSKTTDLKYVWRHRLPRLVIPFGLWSLITILVYQLHEHSLTLHNYLHVMIRIPQKSAAIAMWFMYPLIVMYLLSPLLKVMVDHLSDQLLNYAVGLWLVFEIGTRTLGSLLPAPLRTLVTVNHQWGLVSGYLGYFILGYALTRVKLDKVKASHLAVITVALMLIVALGHSLITVPTNGYYGGFWSYYSLFVVAEASSVFLLAQKVNLPADSKLALNLRRLGTLSFGVYLVHNLYALTITDKFYGLAALPLVGQFLLGFVVCSVLSILTIAVLQRIPGLRFALTGAR